MKTVDDLHLSELITLYYEKHHAIRQGDIGKIREIKNKCPQLFTEEKDSQIRKIIEDAKAFQATKHYKELKKIALKTKLTLIRNPSSDNN